MAGKFFSLLEWVKSVAIFWLLKIAVGHSEIIWCDGEGEELKGDMMTSPDICQIQLPEFTLWLWSQP